MRGHLLQIENPHKSKFWMYVPSNSFALFQIITFLRR